MLTSWSMARYMNEAMVKSTIGRMPTSAAPIATPVKPASLIGVSRTRSRPKRSARPPVLP